MRSILVSSRNIPSKIGILSKRSVPMIRGTGLRRQFSSLGSPMFPQMPYVEPDMSKVVPKGEEDFLTR